MYAMRPSSLSACAFMMRSMLADQPYLLVTTEHGVVTRRLEIFTASTSSREDLLPPLGEVLEFLLDLLQASLGGFRVVAKLEIILGRIGELEVVKLGQVLHGVLVDGIGEVDHLEILLQELLEERRLLERSRDSPAR